MTINQWLDDQDRGQSQEGLQGDQIACLTGASVGGEARQARVQSLEQLLENFKELEWGDKGRFQAQLTQYPQSTSELSFVNLYAWAPIQYPRWGEFEGHILVSYDPGNTGESRAFLPPIGPDPAHVLERLHREFGATFVRVPEQMLSQLSSDIEWRFSEKDHDYLYSPEQVRSLKGSQASTLRRQLRRFQKYVGDRVSVRELEPSLVPDAFTVVQAWLTARLAVCSTEEERVGKQEDAMACRRILSKFQDLSELRGTLVYVNHEPVALYVGELASNRGAPGNCYISHFEKQITRPDLEGLAVYVFQAACSDLAPDCIINRMQDTGLPGLRQWKRSWGPCSLGNKGEVSRIKA